MPESGSRHKQQRKRGGHRIPFGITSAAARLRERDWCGGVQAVAAVVQFMGPRWRAFLVSYLQNARPTCVVLSSNRARLLAFALSGQLINLRRAAASPL